MALNQHFDYLAAEVGFCFFAQRESCCIGYFFFFILFLLLFLLLHMLPSRLNLHIPGRAEPRWASPWTQEPGMPSDIKTQRWALQHKAALNRVAPIQKNPTDCHRTCNRMAEVSSWKWTHSLPVLRAHSALVWGPAVLSAPDQQEYTHKVLVSMFDSRQLDNVVIKYTLHICTVKCLNHKEYRFLTSLHAVELMLPHELEHCTQSFNSLLRQTSQLNLSLFPVGSLGLCVSLCYISPSILLLRLNGSFFYLSSNYRA